MVKSDILVSDVLHGNTSIHRRRPQELYPLTIMVRKGHSILWMEDGYRVLVRYFDPRYHAEVAVPGAQTFEDHAFLQTNYSNLFLLHSNWTEDISLFIQLIRILLQSRNCDFI